jgi:hypothetical protein
MYILPFSLTWAIALLGCLGQHGWYYIVVAACLYLKLFYYLNTLNPATGFSVLWVN